MNLRGLLRYFLWLGCLGFGGPIATVGYMQRDLVERRGWIDRKDFLDGVALGQAMPGPLAAQVAMWVGYLRAGAWGALAVAVPFIAPSFVVVVAAAHLYVRYDGLEVVQALFRGVGPAVIAIVAIAAVKIARMTDGRDGRLWAISAVTGVVTAVTASEIAWLFLAAGLVMVVWERAPVPWRPERALALVPLAGAVETGTLVAVFLFFMKAGAFIFGSGLAIVPFLHEGVVAQRGWLTERQFLDAVAIGLITPGPVVISAAFIGYLVAGPAGAVVAAVGIFTPIYFGVVVPGRWFVRHRDHPALRAFVKGATAAAAGAIGGVTVVLARQTIVDARAAAVGAIALVALWRFRVKEPLLVLAAAAVGLAWR